MVPITVGMTAGAVGAIALGRFLEYLMGVVGPLSGGRTAAACATRRLSGAAPEVLGRTLQLAPTVPWHPEFNPRRCRQAQGKYHDPVFR